MPAPENEDPIARLTRLALEHGTLIELLQPGDDTWLLQACTHPRHVRAGWAHVRRQVRIHPDLTLQTLTDAATLLANDIETDPPHERLPSPHD